MSGIIAQFLMLSTAMHASSMGDAYAALLEQARLAHEGFTGNRGPTLEPVLLAQGHGVAEGGGVAPRLVFVPGSAGFNLAGMTLPSAGAAALAPAAGPSARGPPISHGGYAGEVPGGLAPNPAESLGHELRARAASRSAGRPRPPPVRAPSGSRGDEQEHSPKERSALAKALAAAAADAEAAAGTDAYKPDADPEDDAGDRGAAAADAAPGPADLAEGAAIAAAAVLRCVAEARGFAAAVEAAAADAAAAQAAAEEAAAAAAAAAAPVEAAAAAATAGAAAASSAAAPAPAPGRARARASAARRISKGGREGKGGEPSARRAFVESSFPEAAFRASDVGLSLDGRGLAAPDDADGDSGGSEV